MPETTTTPALVLPIESAGSGEPQVIGGFPGRWIPGQPYAPSALGMSEEDARRVLAEVSTPLVWVDIPVDEPTPEFLRPSGTHIDSSAQQVEADRTRDATRVATPIANEQGEVLHTGELPPVADNPEWVQAEVDRQTALSAGLPVDDARARTVRASYEDEIRSLSKPELEIRATQLGLDPSMRKAELQDAVIAAEGAVVEETLPDPELVAAEAAENEESA